MATTAKAPEPVPDPSEIAKIEAEVEADVKTAENVVYREFEVVRDFVAHVKTQLISFKKGDVINGEAGEFLHATGAAVRPVE